ncbi:MAG: hypothetical protein K2Z81_05210, partial [Cyanobacteria bacterium]|nr:hypothetical protein [Cyanobacteriota bacterium]
MNEMAPYNLVKRAARQSGLEEKLRFENLGASRAMHGITSAKSGSAMQKLRSESLRAFRSIHDTAKEGFEERRSGDRVAPPMKGLRQRRRAGGRNASQAIHGIAPAPHLVCRHGVGTTRESSGNVLFLCVAIGCVILVLVGLAFWLHLSFFSNQLLQDSSEKVVLQAAQKLNDNDNAGKLNNLTV